MAALVGIGAAGAANATITVSVEAAGAQHSTKALHYGGEGNFDGLGPGVYFTQTVQFDPNVSANMSTFFIDPASALGGAGGVGNYLTATPFGTVLRFPTSTVNYFGLWASTIASGNTVTFLNHDVAVASYDLADLFAALVPNPAGYLGNPTANYHGQNPDKAYAFFNFASDEVFDEIMLTRNGAGGFAVDNLTVGYINPVTASPDLPEPATWATMLIGFGMAGAAMRHRRRVPAA